MEWQSILIIILLISYGIYGIRKVVQVKKIVDNSEYAEWEKNEKIQILNTRVKAYFLFIVVGCLVLFISLVL